MSVARSSEGKTSFSLNVNGQNQYSTPIVNVAGVNGTTSQTLRLRAPREFLNVNGILDHAMTKDQTLRASYSLNRQELQNLGVGNYDLPERAWGGRQLNNNIRIQEAGPLGRRAFMNTRFGYMQTDLDLSAKVEAPTIIVLDAFNAGGAQTRQDTRLQGVTLASDVDYVRGVHSWRFGLQSDANWARNIQANNYLGTYTFSSPEAFAAGTPLLYTRVVGDPRVQFFWMRAAVYGQDDIKLKGLTLSPGIRYSMQSNVDDWSGIDPRFGLTWAPRPNGATTVRASAGIFHVFMPPALYERTLRIDGERQRELIILDPAYPDPGDIGTLSAVNKYQLGNFDLQRNVRYSVGLDQVLSPKVRVNILYNWIDVNQQPRGDNRNALVNGVRPDPNYANVIAAVTDAQARRQELNLNSTLSLASQSTAAQQARLSWRRMNIQAGYTFVHARSNSSDAFTPPPTGNLEDEWGPTPQDAPYRINVVATGNQLRNLTTVLTWNANSGSVYTETTGFDDNGDGIVNDRRPVSACDRCAATDSRRSTPASPTRSSSARNTGSRTRPGAISAERVHQHQQPDRPSQLHRLQRRDHVAVLRPADECDQPAARRRRHEHDVLTIGRGFSLAGGPEGPPYGRRSRREHRQRVRQHLDTVGDRVRRCVLVRPMADAASARDEDHSGRRDARHEERIVVRAADHPLTFQPAARTRAGHSLDDLRRTRGRRIHVDDFTAHRHTAPFSDEATRLFGVSEHVIAAIGVDVPDVDLQSGPGSECC